MKTSKIRWLVTLVSLVVALGAGGAAQAQKKLVVYSSNDSTLNDLVFGAFTKETGIEVEPVAAGSGVVIRRMQAEKDAAAGRHRLGRQPLAAADQQGAVRALCLEEQGRDAGRVPRPRRSAGSAPTCTCW